MAPVVWSTGEQRELARLGARGRTLALLRLLQIGSGMVGHVILLTRWSPDAQTDLFLLLSSVPWLASAAMLVGGLEMALPAAYHRVIALVGDVEPWIFARRIARSTLPVAALAALASGTLVWRVSAALGLDAPLALWMGIALGGQLVPATLGGLCRGLLLATDRLVRLQLAVLAGSLAMLAGYALLPGTPAFALPLAAAGSVVVSALLAWLFGRTVLQTGPQRDSPAVGSLWRPLLRDVVVLGAASGLLHVQTIIEQTAVRSMGAGRVAAFSVAGRGWDALMQVVVAACVMPAYPRWASGGALAGRENSRRLLRWSLGRTGLVSLLAAVVCVGVALFLERWFVQRLDWQLGAWATQMFVVLGPRFLLLAALQPLILKRFAQGTPWLPVAGAALGVGVVAVGALTLVRSLGLSGLALTTAAGVLPGWLILGWREWRER